MKLTLNDGTVLEDSSALLSGDLFLYMNGYGMQEIFDLLIDPEKAKKIVFTQANGENEDNGLITAVLRKG